MKSKFCGPRALHCSKRVCPVRVPSLGLQITDKQYSVLVEIATVVSMYRMFYTVYILFFFLNPFLFASCTCTFSKWLNTKKGVERSAQ
jgi:hypothetical protein